MKPGARAVKAIKLTACIFFVIVGLLMCLSTGREAYQFAHDGGTVDAKVMKIAPAPKGKGMWPLLKYKVNDTVYLRFGDEVTTTNKYHEGQTVSIRYLKEDPHIITMLDPNRNLVTTALWAALALVAFIIGKIVALSSREENPDQPSNPDLHTPQSTASRRNSGGR